MRLQPVKTHKPPMYATRAILDAHPELLRLVPKRWQTNAVLLTALATAGVIVSTRWLPAANGAVKPDVSRVAPIFLHGDGRGAFGCESVNPPAFLSEDEAREVVLMEGKQAGIDFAIDAKTLSNVPVPLTSYGWDEKKKTQESKRRDLLLDGWEKKRKIGFEYISEKDYQDWIAPSIYMSTVQSYDFLDAAKSLRAGLTEVKPTGAYGVFYNPMISLSEAATGLTLSKTFSDSTLVSVRVLVPDEKGVVQKEDTVTLTLGEQKITLRIGSDQAEVGGKKLTLPAPVISWHGTTYVPLRAVAEVLDITVKWNPTTALVSIKIPGVDWAPSSQIMETEAKAPEKPLSLAFTNYDYRARERMAQDLARVELRQQVRDFIAWLKAEKVI